MSKTGRPLLDRHSYLRLVREVISGAERALGALEYLQERAGRRLDQDHVYLVRPTLAKALVLANGLGEALPEGGALPSWADGLPRHEVGPIVEMGFRYAVELLPCHCDAGTDAGPCHHRPQCPARYRAPVATGLCEAFVARIPAPVAPEEGAPE